MLATKLLSTPLSCLKTNSWKQCSSWTFGGICCSLNEVMSERFIKKYQITSTRCFSSQFGKNLKSGWDWKKRVAVQKMTDHKIEEKERSKRVQLEISTFKNKKELGLHSITDKLSIKMTFPSKKVHDRLVESLKSTFHVEHEVLPIDEDKERDEFIQDEIIEKKDISKAAPILYFSYYDYDEILRFFTEEHEDISFEPIPPFVFQVLDHYENQLKSFKAKRKKAPKEYDLSLRLPSNLYNNILPFQKDGIEYAISRDGRVMLCDEMGLGKTLQALGIASFYPKEWPILIIGPCSLHNNWRRELNTWIEADWMRKHIGKEFNFSGDSLDPYICIVDSSQSLAKVIEETKDNPKKYLVYIISYDLASKNAENGTSEAVKWLLDFSIIITDESHMLKNDGSKRTQNIIPLLRNAKRLVLISGTASPSRPIELFTQMKALLCGPKSKKTLLKKTEFGYRYCDLKTNFFTGADYRGNRFLSELNLLLSRSIMIRRLKRDVLTQLPPKKRYLTHLNLPQEDIGPHILTFESFSRRKGKNLGFDPNDIEILQKFNLTAIAKQRTVARYARYTFKKGEKFIIFAHHRSVMNAIEEEIKKEIEEVHTNEGKKLKYVRIDGETPIEQRHAISQEFREDPDVRVAILSIAVAGVGLNFVPCSTVVFGELTWNSGFLAQAEDRAHRIGQKSTVNVHYLVAKNTLDEYLWELLGTKIDIVSETLDGEKEKEEEHHITKGSKEVTNHVDQ